jgi:hypothetical protein
MRCRASILLNRPCEALDTFICRRFIFVAHVRFFNHGFFVTVAGTWGRFFRLAKFLGFPDTSTFFGNTTVFSYGDFELAFVVTRLGNCFEFGRYEFPMKTWNAFFGIVTHGRGFILDLFNLVTFWNMFSFWFWRLAFILIDISALAGSFEGTATR